MIRLLTAARLVAVGCWLAGASLGYSRWGWRGAVLGLLAGLFVGAQLPWLFALARSLFGKRPFK